eukprot:568253-Rhodomonas_salina.2
MQDVEATVVEEPVTMTWRSDRRCTPSAEEHRRPGLGGREGSSCESIVQSGESMVSLHCW